MINRVVLVGRLTRDLDLRKTPSGASVVSFSIACNRRTKVEGQPDADFINCVAWNKTADLMAQYLHKGALIGIEGRIQTRTYDDKDGKKVYVTEVVTESVQFLEPKSASGNSQSYSQPSYSQPYSQGTQSNQGNQGYGNMGGYTPDETNRSSFDKEFANDTLDIASDDLPF